MHHHPHSHSHHHHPHGHSHHHHDHHPHSHHHHGHSHGHSHDYSQANKSALAASFALTAVVMLAEFVYGLLANSLALLSDALHMLMHAVALALSYFAAYAMSHFSHPQKTFGYARYEIIAAFINAILIAIMTIIIIYEAVKQLLFPEEIDVATMLIVACIGLATNVASALLLMRADRSNLNIKSSIIHMLSDLLSSVAIVAGGVLVHFTGWLWVDPLLALLIAAVIARWAAGLFRQTLDILLEAAPQPVEPLVARILQAVPKLRALHDVHAFSVGTQQVVFSAHAVISREDLPHWPEILAAARAELAACGVQHVTLQPEWRDDCSCGASGGDGGGAGGAGGGGRGGVCDSCAQPCEFSCERAEFC